MNRRLRPASTLFAAVLAILPALAMADTDGEAADVQAKAVPLDYADEQAAQVGALDFRGGLSLTSPHPQFGGLSGLLVSPDCAAFTAVGDTGWLWRGRLRFDASARLIGVDDVSGRPLKARSGRPIAGKASGDAEALARGTDGALIVAFEGRHRLFRYARPDATPETLPTPEDLPLAPRNGGIEALTTLGDGRLLAITEDLVVDGGVRGWVFDRRGWSALVVRTANGFRPTGAATLPNGDVLLLDRRFPPVGARLRQIDARTIGAGAVVDGPVLATLSGSHAVDNFEAVDVCRRHDGEVLAIILSDDNFSPVQRTLMLAFAMPAPVAGAGR